MLPDPNHTLFTDSDVTQLKQMKIVIEKRINTNFKNQSWYNYGNVIMDIRNILKERNCMLSLTGKKNIDIYKEIIHLYGESKRGRENE